MNQSKVFDLSPSESISIFVEQFCRVGLTEDVWNDIQKQIREITNYSQVTKSKLVLETT